MKKQYYNIKFPFSIDNSMGLFIDLNENNKELLLSNIWHLILTPKGQRYRMPDFGTDLIKFIFEPNSEGEIWEGIKEEITNSVSKYIPNVLIKDIQILKEEKNDGIYVYIKFSEKIGNETQYNEDTIRIK